MNRIAITGSCQKERTIFSNALSAMTGIKIVTTPPYSLLSSKYKLDIDIAKCEWPDSFVYCLGAFTQRIMIESKYEDAFISNGSVFNELGWIKSRYPHIELIYERSMIQSFESVVVDYAMNEYDFIFHINSSDSSDPVDKCLKQIFSKRNFTTFYIDTQNKEDALNKMAEQLEVKPLLSAKYAFLKNENLL